MVRLLPHTPEGVQGTRWLGVDYRQTNTPCEPLGQTRELLAQEHAFVGGRRQADIYIYSPDSLQMMCILTAAIFTRNDSGVSKTRTRHYAERVICTASPDWACDFAAKRVRFGSCN